MEREEVSESKELILNIGLHGVGQLLNCFKLQFRMKEWEAHLFNGSSNIPFRGLLQEIKEKYM